MCVYRCECIAAVRAYGNFHHARNRNGVEVRVFLMDRVRVPSYRRRLVGSNGFVVKAVEMILLLPKIRQQTKIASKGIFRF